MAKYCRAVTKSLRGTGSHFGCVRDKAQYNDSNTASCSPLILSMFKYTVHRGDLSFSFRLCSLTYQHISVVGENGKAQIVFQEIRVKVLRDLRGRQNWEDFSVQLSKYAEITENQRDLRANRL